MGGGGWRGMEDERGSGEGNYETNPSHGLHMTQYYLLVVDLSLSTKKVLHSIGAKYFQTMQNFQKLPCALSVLLFARNTLEVFCVRHPYSHFAYLLFDTQISYLQE